MHRRRWSGFRSGCLLVLSLVSACGDRERALSGPASLGVPLAASRPARDPRDAVVPPPAMSSGGWFDSVSIEVPPAPNGSEPRVALTANHMVTDGILGSGYQLDIGSSIVRRGAEGGVPGAVEDDSYFLDGRRLAQVISSLAPPPEETPPEVYQPETFDGSQLEYHEDTNTWTLGRDGWTFVYGSRDGTGILATRNLGGLIQAVGPGHRIPCNFGNQRCNTAEWLLSRVEDPHHNVITYDYVVPDLPDDLFDGYGAGSVGVHLLDVVRYNAGAARINFVYARRPDAQVSFASGAADFATKRLAEIVTYAGTGAQFSKYRIEYKDDAETDCDGEAITGTDLVGRPVQSLVQRIVRVAAAGHADAGVERVLRCAQTHDEDVPWVAPRDVTEDIPRPAGIGTDVPDDKLLPVPLHLDGDGMTDIVVLAYNGNVGVQATALRAVNGEAAFAADGPEVVAWVAMLEDAIQPGHFQDGLGFAFTDLNRDGWTDLVYEQPPSDGDTGDVEVARWEPNTGGFVIEPLDLLACDLRHGSFADINGDGFPELVRLAHAEDDACIERVSEWLPNTGVAPWVDRGPTNDSWLSLATPGAAIAGAVSVAPPSLVSGWSDEHYVEAQGRLIDLNADGLADLTYAMYARWSCLGIGIDCEPEWDSLHSRIYWGDGYGSFVDSGLAAGGPVMTRRFDFTPGADSRILGATQTAVDFMRSGRPQLVTTTSDEDSVVFGAKWRGIRWGFGDDEVTGPAQPHGSVGSDFSFTLPQQPGLGDDCWRNASWMVHGDFDGDGFADVLSFNLNEEPLPGCDNTGYCVQLYRSARSTSQGRIVSSDGSWGGRTSLEWDFSAHTFANNHSLDYPGNAEVLAKVDGDEGEIRLHYAHPTQSQGRFRGFGLVEREPARGGLERFAFGVSPALAGRLLYATRFRRDNTLERATVFAYESPAPCPPFTVCDTEPSTGNPSSYVVDTSAPYVNLPVRQCEYEVERAGIGDGGDVDIPGLIDHCYAWNGRVPPSQSQLLAAAGHYRYPPLGWAASDLSSAMWEDDDRTGYDAPRAVALSDASEPDGSHEELWSFSELTDWTTGARSVGPRWPAPAGVPLPPPVDLEQLGGVHERARGSGFSAYVVDRTYGTTAFELVDEMLHRDVMTTDDDLHRVSVSEWPGTDLASGLWRRLVSTELTDGAGQILTTMARTEFDAAHVDSPGRVTTCGKQGQDCRDERFTYHANGESATHTRPDGAVESSSQSPFCGTETHTDEAGRQEVTVYDDRCRVSSRSFRGVVTTYAYDGQNRVTRRTTTPNGGAPTTTVLVTQDDDFLQVQDTGFTEPRLRELRDEDDRLWLTFLDDFGRVTRRVVCSQLVGSSPPICAAGTVEVIELNLWGTDGLLFASARPYVTSGPGAETPAVSAETRDGAGRVILLQTPAHLDVQNQGTGWSAVQTWYAPGRVVTEDALDRVTVASADTLHRAHEIAGLVVERAELDAMGNVTTAVGADGMAVELAYTPRHQVWTETRVAAAESIGPGGQTVTLPWVRRRDYDVLGRPLRVTHPDGTAEEVALDPTGRPTAATHLDANGAATTLRAIAYTSLSGGLDEVVVTDESGHQVRRRFDGLDRMLFEDDGLGTTRSWTYDPGGQAATLVESGGGLSLTTQMTYDGGGRMSTRTDPDGGVTRTTYNGAGQPVEEIDPNGVRRVASYHFSGLPFESRLARPDGSWLLARIRYDLGGRPEERIEEGVRHRFEHDDLDRLVFEEIGGNAAFINTQLDYEGRSERVLTRTDTVVGAPFPPAVTAWTYDGWGRMRSVENPDGDVEGIGYDVMGRVRRHVDGEGFARETRYDDRGRVVFARGLGRDTTEVQYEVPATFVRQAGPPVTDAWRVASADGAGEITERWFDAAGRLLGEARPDGTSSERRYAGGRLTDELVIGADGAVVSVARTTYRADGIFDARFGPALPAAFAPFDPATFDGPVVRMGIADGGRLDWIDASGERTDFEYEADGLLRAERYRRLTHALVRDFDAGDPLSHPRVVGETLRHPFFGPIRTTTYEHDTVGRLVRRLVDDGASVEEARWGEFDHEGRARRTSSFLDGTVQVEHLWDFSSAGKVNSRETRVAGAAPRITRWTWLRNGARSSVTGPSGSGLAYDYGPTFDHEVDRVRRLGGTLVAEVRSRNDRGQPTRIDIGAGGWIDLDHDAMGRLIDNQRFGSAGTLEAGSHLTYDGLGRIELEEMADVNSTWSNRYHYNPAGHLLAEERTRGGVTDTLTYEVNHAGYRVSTTGTLDGVDQAMTAEYDTGYPVERLAAVVKGGVRFPIAYDPWDSVTGDQHGNVFTYTPSGGLRTHTRAGITRTFVRDADGIPWGETDGLNLRLTTWDLDPSGRPIEVDDAVAGQWGYASVEGVLIGRLGYGPPGFWGQSAAPNGSLSNEVGSGRDEGSAFGVGVRPSGTPGERMLFAGLEELPGGVGVHLGRRRAYDAETGRFLALDPIGLGGGLHRSLYASGDPVNRRDPMGLSDCASGPPPTMPRIDPMPPQIIEGMEGGPASPFGPGVAVSYVGQYMGDKTFQEKWNNWHVASNAGIFSGGGNYDDDTDAASGSNTGGSDDDGAGKRTRAADAPGSDKASQIVEGWGGLGEGESVLMAALMITEQVDPTKEGAPGDFGEDGADGDASSVGEEGQGVDTLADDRTTAPAPPTPSQGPPTIGKVIEIDAVNGSVVERLKQVLDAYLDAAEDPLHLESAARQPRSDADPVEVGGYMVRYAFDPFAYQSRIARPQKLAPHGMSREEALRLKAHSERYWAITPFEQTIAPSGVPLDVLMLLGFPGGAAGNMARGVGGTISRHYADDVVRVGSSIVKGGVRAGQRVVSRVRGEALRRTVRTAAGNGRLEKVFARVTKESVKEGGQRTNEAARAAMRGLGGPTDDAGHMAANGWGGKLDALVPQNLSVNRGVYRQMEQWVAKKAGSVNQVDVLIEPLYDSATAGRPFAIDFMVRVGGDSFLVQIANPL